VRAIEQKQVQVQAALQAQAKVAQATAEAEQAVAKARGDDGRWRIHSRRFSPAFSSYAAIPVPERKPGRAAGLPQAPSKGK